MRECLRNQTSTAMSLFAVIIFLKTFIYERIFVSAHAVWSFALFLYLLWYTRKQRRAKILDEKRFSVSMFLCVITVFVSFLHSIVFVRHRYLDFMHVYTIVAGVLLCMLSFYHGLDRRKLMKAIAVSAAGICVIAIYTLVASRDQVLFYLREHRLTSQFAEEFLNRRRTFYPFVSPDTLGGFLILSLGMTLPFLSKGKKYISLFLLQLAALLCTKSLGTYAAFFFGACLYLLNARGHLRRRISKSLLIGSGVALIAIFLFRQHTEGAHLTPLFSLQKRVDYVTRGIGMIREHPFWGWGFGQYYQTTGTKYSHNMFVQLWAEGGILLSLSIIIFIALTLSRAIRNIRTSIDDDSRIESTALFCAFSAFLIHNLVDFEFFILQASYAWWVCCGLIHYVYASRRQAGSANPANIG